MRLRSGSELQFRKGVTQKERRTWEEIEEEERGRCRGLVASGNISEIRKYHDLQRFWRAVP
jgi:hypothetical protein